MNLHENMKRTNKKSNTDEFVIKAKNAHGERYDYSKSLYDGFKTRLIIICKEHGEFEQTPDVHLRSSGCSKCSRTNASNKRKTSLESWINSAKDVHEDKFDYSKVEYINTYTKVIIICPEHGEFEQQPKHHLQGRGCAKCSGIENNPYTTEEWVNKMVDKYGDKYDYSKVNYINTSTKVIIKCPKHGEFMQNPDNHNQGSGCPKCACNFKYTQESWIKIVEEVHNNKYDYSKVDYINSSTKIIIICKEHGEFLQTPSTHMKGSGCPRCSPFCAHTSKEWINIIKERFDNIFEYDYSKVEYKNTHTKVEIICKEHGSFFQIALDHYYGAGCPLCFHKTEGKLYLWLSKYFDDVVKQPAFKWCKSPITDRKYPFDFYIKELNCIIELDGCQHFKQVMNWSNPEYTMKKDVYKMQKANKKNISVIRLLQKDVQKNDIKWLEEKLLPLLKKFDNVQNHYITNPKKEDIYDKHKELYDTEIIFDEDAEDIKDIDIEYDDSDEKPKSTKSTKSKSIKSKKIKSKPKLKDTESDEESEEEKTPKKSKEEIQKETITETQSQIKSYINSHNKIPTINDENEESKKLGFWLKNNRNNHKNKKAHFTDPKVYDQMTVFLQEIDKSKSWKTDWKKNLDQLEDYINKHEKLPPSKEYLGQWMSDQKKYYKKKDKGMRDEEIYNLWTDFIEEYPDYFKDKTEVWKSHLNSLEDYIEEHDKMPSTHDKNKKISKLGAWINTQKYNHTHNTEIMQNEEICELWEEFAEDNKHHWSVKEEKKDSSKDLFIVNRDKTQEYFDTYHKLPSTVDLDEDIKKLGKWVNTQNQNYKSKTRCMSNKETYNMWTKFTEKNKKYIKSEMDNYEEQLDKLQDYIDKYEILPTRKSDETKVITLAKWYEKQKNNYKKNEERMQQEKYRNRWDKFIDHNKTLNLT